MLFRTLALFDTGLNIATQLLPVRILVLWTFTYQLWPDVFFYRIHHYCGPVTYTASCFAEKNQDFLPKHISSGMYQSKLPIMQYLFPEGNPKKSSKKPTSISSNLRTSLQALLQNLSQRRNHYVFCIRPNEFKEPRAFELPLVQHQVRYLGYGHYFLHWIHWISLNLLLSGYYHLQIYGVLVTTFI